jgi:hypothetical protein
MQMPVGDQISLRIAPAEAVKQKEKKPPHEKQSAEKSGNKPNAGLPPYKLLTQDGRHDAGQDTAPWPDWMSGEDGGYVEDLTADERLYFINLDNDWLQSYRRTQRGQILKDGITQKYILGMRIFLLGIERALRGLSEDDDFDPDKFRRLAAKGASSTMLTLSDHLPKIITPVSEPE